MTPVVLVGPTASGKSALAMAAARTLQGAGQDVGIVAVDSMQVYRGMDIGTAKPTAADQVEFPHYGIDLAEPGDDFTVVRFVEAYDLAVAECVAAGRHPIVVAGTGLYLKAVLDRFEPPGQWPELREQFEDDPDLPGLYARLVEVDPAAAAKIDPANRRRVARALEVCIGSGRPFSSFGPGVDAYPPIATTQIGLRWERTDLTRRIDTRVDTMIADGLVDEVATLLAAPVSRTARQALGYKEIVDHLEGQVPLDAAIASIKLRTRQFAVRQERWFRRDPRVTWVTVQHDSLEVLPTLLGAMA